MYEAANPLFPHHLLIVIVIIRTCGLDLWFETENEKHRDLIVEAASEEGDCPSHHDVLLLLHVPWKERVPPWQGNRPIVGTGDIHDPRQCRFDEHERLYKKKKKKNDETKKKKKGRSSSSSSSVWWVWLGPMELVPLETRCYW